MGEKIILSVHVVVTIVIGSILYSHFYPWLYNKVNHVTKRGEDLHDKIDMLNTVIMLTSLYAVMGSIGILFTVATKQFIKYKLKK